MKGLLRKAVTGRQASGCGVGAFPFGREGNLWTIASTDRSSMPMPTWCTASRSIRRDRVPDAEDVVQAVFLKFYEKPPTWFCDGPERNGGRALAAVPEREPARDDRLRAWLIRVTVNECKSLWRSLWRQRVELRDIRDGRCSSLRGARFRRHVPRGAVRGVGRATREVPHRGAPALLRGHGYPRDRRGAGHQGAHVRTRLVRARKLLKQSLKEAWEDEQLKPVQSHDGRGPCLC